MKTVVCKWNINWKENSRCLNSILGTQTYKTSLGVFHEWCHGLGVLGFCDGSILAFVLKSVTMGEGSQKITQNYVSFMDDSLYRYWNHSFSVNKHNLRKKGFGKWEYSTGDLG